MELSIKATQTVKAGLSLEASLEITTAQAAEGLLEFFAPVIGPDETFDLTALFVLKNRKLRWSREQVVAADFAHREQVEILTELLSDRDVLAVSLGGKLVDLRRVCLGLYDEKELVRLGLGGAVSQDPTIVYRQGHKAWLRFQNLEQLKTSDWLEVEIKIETLVKGLGDDVQALGDTLTEIQKQNRRVQKAASERRKAAADFDRNHQLIGSSTETDYRMAGLDDEADRARPSRRRSPTAEPLSTSGEPSTGPADETDETGEVQETEPIDGGGESPAAIADPPPSDS